MPTRAAVAPSGSGEEATASAAWRLDPAAYEALLREPLEVVEVEAIEAGDYGVLRLVVRTVHGEVPIKWKPARPSLERINNSPRRSVAAYQVQRLFLEPEEYVVPTTALACIELPRENEPEEASGDCVIGTASTWLDGLRSVDRLIDPERFATDAAYAVHRANLNLLLILIDHSDSHSSNLLESSLDPDNRLFSIDNDIALSSWFRNPFVLDWNRLRLPALSARAVDRLRALERSDLDVLGVLTHLEPGESGHLLPAEPVGNLAPRRGVRRRGRVVQIGLTTAEIGRIWERRSRVLQLVDSGRLAVF